MPKGKSKAGKSGKKPEERNKSTDEASSGKQERNKIQSPEKQMKKGLIARFFTASPPSSSYGAERSTGESSNGQSDTQRQTIHQAQHIEEKVPKQIETSVECSSLAAEVISKNETKAVVSEKSASTSKQLLSPSQKEAQKKKKKQKKAESQKGQTVIGEFFQRRRSNRKNKSELEEEKQKKLEEVILQQKEEGLEVKEVEGKGRGVFSTKVFEKGDFICEYAGELVDYQTAKEREKLYEDKPVGCYMYYFAFKNKKYCVDATKETDRLGRLLNHSKTGNCVTKIVSIKDTPYLILLAARKIKVGEELLYDYGERSKTILESHPWLKS